MRGECVVVRVYLNPNASRDEIIGIDRLADEKIVLKIKVRAVPEKGKANKALIAFLAKQVGVPKSSLGVVSGTQSRHKVVEIVGDGAKIIASLETLPRT